MKEIEREIVVSASIGRVWEAITSPVELRQWFGDVAEFDLSPGSKGRVGWTEYDSVVELVVEVVEPPNHFAFSWSSLENSPFDPAKATRVDFRLQEVDGSTRITLTETGFTDLPQDLAAKTLESNNSGWTHELEDLAGYLEETRV